MSYYVERISLVDGRLSKDGSVVSLMCGVSQMSMRLNQTWCLLTWNGFRSLDDNFKSAGKVVSTPWVVSGRIRLVFLAGPFSCGTVGGRVH